MGEERAVWQRPVVRVLRAEDIRDEFDLEKGPIYSRTQDSVLVDADMPLRDVAIEMTLSAPGCPVAGEMPGWVEDAVRKVEGVRSAKAELTFDPPWDASKMSDEAKLALNMF